MEARTTSRPPHGGDARRERDLPRGTATRDVSIGAVLGGIPGLVVLLLPILLAELGVISSDQSQVGFLGVPILFLGILVGALGAAARVNSSGAVGLGVALGFGAGLVVGLLLQTGLDAVGLTVPAAWLFVAACAMVAGAALGARVHGAHATDVVARAAPDDQEPTDAHPADGPSRRVGWEALRPGRSLWLFPAAVGAAWAIVVALLATTARLTTSGDDQPSWAEVVATTAYNFVLIFVVTFVVSLVMWLVSRSRVGSGEQTAEPVAPAEPSGAVTEPTAEPTTEPTTEPTAAQGIWAWTIRGHPVMPTTTEGRLALALALVSIVPFVGGPAMFATPVLLVLAIRRGDRALALLLPLLVGIFLVLFVVAEFTIGHD